MLEAVRSARGNDEFRAKWEKMTGGDGGLTAAYDSAVRDDVLDGEGVAAEVLFPDADVLGTGRIAASPFGSGLAGGAGTTPELALAGAKAHNRWLADFCAQSPDRRIGVAIIPILYDLDAAVAEIHAARELGLRGVLIPTRWFDQPAYHDPRYDVVWAACEALGMVLHTHSGSGPADYGLGRSMIAIYATEAYWWAARPLWVLLWAGVFERYPRPEVRRRRERRVVGARHHQQDGREVRGRPQHREDGQRVPRRAEDEAERVLPPQLRPRRVDAGRRGHRPPLRRRASGAGSGATISRIRRERSRTRGTGCGSASTTSPRRTRARMLGQNAADLYGVDTEKLAPLVERIGPTHDEVHGDALVEPVPA